MSLARAKQRVFGTGVTCNRVTLFKPFTVTKAANLLARLCNRVEGGERRPLPRIASRVLPKAAFLTRLCEKRGRLFRDGLFHKERSTTKRRVCQMICQISSLYWRIVRSEEKKPALAMFTRSFCAQPLRSRVAWSARDFIRQ